ncbi:hypothetical protein APR50_32530 [Variovorax paradoxus]|jgi:hypothetical protein|uniref:hypothetical protein n=1 Tax=Variovorax paradoxus TaxID=34073 RepID=UPI0006E6A7AD|nr:hypothetical protein APR52_01690 [Variovorax paradoxus]KPV00553.1 hypothetical protein APR50_32530 [Variovorax paradoxus]KPV01365.1 hypothetical protein APR49_31425 [Variovorax paradoxus]KPV16399.1 hypothetical protein APR47_43435 [Variovorax paradoxus]KPV16866.1 hypothetical protein APR51_28845 [Variovorax paradoxus]
MSEIYLWLADRYGFEHVAMRRAGKEWLRAGFTVLAISAGVLVFLYQLASQPDSSLLRIAAASIPSWVPAVTFAGLWTGFVMAGYGWMVRHVGELLRKQL